jgi:hypothetical protein
MKLATSLASTVLTLLLGAAQAQTLGHWQFEESSFFGVAGPGNPTVVDDSGLQNHGYQPDLNRRLLYTTDAFSGSYALDFNNPLDPRPNGGHLVIPTTPSLEPTTGYIEMFIKVDHHHAATLLSKATFQFHNREPGPNPPTFWDGDEERLTGRTVYELRMLSDGRVQAAIGNDSLQQASPWTHTTSGAGVVLGFWNKVAMHWDGSRLNVQLNGIWSQDTFYQPMAGRGLSYLATGIDPTLGPISNNVSIGNSTFVGLMDDVLIASSVPCGAGPTARTLR